MVNTRRRRAPQVVSETPSVSPDPSVRDIDVDPRGLNAARSVASNSRAPSADSIPTATPPAEPPSPPAEPPSPPADPPSPASMAASDRTLQSTVSFAGPGQRGTQLLAVAPPEARFSYLNAFENMNDEFAEYLREEGIALPRGQHLLFNSCSPPSLFHCTHSRPHSIYAFALQSIQRIRVPCTHSRCQKTRIREFLYAFALHPLRIRVHFTHIHVHPSCA